MLQIDNKTVGSKHPDTAISLANLAELYKTQMRYAEAKILYKKALVITENFLSKEHPTTQALPCNSATMLF